VRRDTGTDGKQSIYCDSHGLGSEQLCRIRGGQYSIFLLLLQTLPLFWRLNRCEQIKLCACSCAWIILNYAIIVIILCHCFDWFLKGFFHFCSLPITWKICSVLMAYTFDLYCSLLLKKMLLFCVLLKFNMIKCCPLLLQNNTHCFVYCW